MPACYDIGIIFHLSHFRTTKLRAFRAPKFLPILISGNFVPKSVFFFNGQGVNPKSLEIQLFFSQHFTLAVWVCLVHRVALLRILQKISFRLRRHTLRRAPHQVMSLGNQIHDLHTVGKKNKQTYMDLHFVRVWRTILRTVPSTCSPHTTKKRMAFRRFWVKEPRHSETKKKKKVPLVAVYT